MYAIFVLPLLNTINVNVCMYTLVYIYFFVC